MRVLLSWSSGKDSAWSLHVLRQQPDVEVVGLLTTVNETHERVAMHAVRQGLVRAQADAAGLPLREVGLPHPCPNGVYEERMAAALAEVKAEGVEAVAFGDLYLEDIRAYREQRMAGTGLSTRFPLWQRPTRDLAREMMAGGLRAIVTSVDPKQIDPSFVGRAWDESFLADLPESADPCGENGEFHSFVWAGPMYRAPLDVKVGQTVERDGFWFADVLPATAA